MKMCISRFVMGKSSSCTTAIRIAIFDLRRAGKSDSQIAEQVKGSKMPQSTSRILKLESFSRNRPQYSSDLARSPEKSSSGIQLENQDEFTVKISKWTICTVFGRIWTPWKSSTHASQQNPKKTMCSLTQWEREFVLDPKPAEVCRLVLWNEKWPYWSWWWEVCSTSH